MKQIKLTFTERMMLLVVVTVFFIALGIAMCSCSGVRCGHKGCYATHGKVGY
jgi:hypothetical protein